jgi:predicted metal-binding protein
MIIKEFNPKKELIFDIKVCEACKSCKRYGLTGCCPPNIGSFEYYKKLLKRYTYGKVFIEKFVVDNIEKYKEIGRESSLELHKVLLIERKKLLDEGHFFNVILGGGSCKWCEKCSIPCKQPQFRAIPIEATGINVVATLAKIGFWIKFPVKKIFYRVGMLLWDEAEK